MLSSAGLVSSMRKPRPQPLPLSPSTSDTGIDEARWLDVVHRNPSADGTFVYAVSTTGIYCRPTCPSRRPHRHNVCYFASGTDAVAAGYRACRRCHPDATDQWSDRRALITSLCRVLETEYPTPTLAVLAGRFGRSPFHLLRTFKNALGVTPRAYAAALRVGRLRAGLPSAATVTEALYEAGYGSSSRLYERTSETLGMTPTDLRRGGAGHDIMVATAACRLGSVLVARSGRGLCAILLGDSVEAVTQELATILPKATVHPADDTFDRQVATVVAFIDRPTDDLGLSLDIQGTAFQRRVWEALRSIPPGTVLTYSQLAQRIGTPSAVRAVASACAANVLAVAIPCHRIVRSDGGLSGYRWGVARKRALLDMEGRDSAEEPAA